MFDFVLQQSVLETIVIVGIAIAIIGYFWQIILIGGTFLLVAFVLYNHTPKIEIKPSVEVAQVVEHKQEVAKEVIISPSVKYVDPRRDEYVRDCVSFGFAKQWCKDNWDDKLEKEE